jgi:hypothetical protein
LNLVRFTDSAEFPTRLLNSISVNSRVVEHRDSGAKREIQLVRFPQ